MNLIVGTTERYVSGSDVLKTQLSCTFAIEQFVYVRIASTAVMELS